MISTCANPACNKPFHYLRGGRLYRFDTVRRARQSGEVANATCAISPTRIAVFFWLCKECASRLSLRFDGRNVTVVPCCDNARLVGRAPVIRAGAFNADEQRVIGELASQ